MLLYSRNRTQVSFRLGFFLNNFIFSKPVEMQGRKVKGPNPFMTVWQPIAVQDFLNVFSVYKYGRDSISYLTFAFNLQFVAFFILSKYGIYKEGDSSEKKTDALQKIPNAFVCRRYVRLQKIQKMQGKADSDNDFPNIRKIRKH